MRTRPLLNMIVRVIKLASAQMLTGKLKEAWPNQSMQVVVRSIPSSRDRSS